MTTKATVVIIGTGAIGGLIAGYASAAGHVVLAVDGWKEHVDEISRRGLSVGGVRGSRRFAVQTAMWTRSLTLPREPDIIFVSAKSHDTERAVDLAAAAVGPRTAVVSTQNGLTEDLLAERLGHSSVVGAVTEVGGHIAGPGKIMETRAGGGFVIGELDGTDTPRVRFVRDVLDSCAPTVITPVIRGVLWSKLTWNCVMNPLTAISGLGQGHIWTREPLRRLAVRVAREAAAVAHADGAQLEPLTFLDVDLPALVSDDPVVAAGALDATVRRYESQLHRSTSMREDVRHGRVTEVDYLNGHVANRGAQLGIPTPLNAELVDLVHFLELGSKHPGVRLLSGLIS